MNMLTTDTYLQPPPAVTNLHAHSVDPLLECVVAILIHVPERGLGETGFVAAIRLGLGRAIELDIYIAVLGHVALGKRSVFA